MLRERERVARALAQQQLLGEDDSGELGGKPKNGSAKAKGSSKKKGSKNK